MEIDYIETTGPITRVAVMREPADCCQERTTSGGCGCVRKEDEEVAEEVAMDHLGTTELPTDISPYRYGWVVSFESAYLTKD